MQAVNLRMLWVRFAVFGGAMLLSFALILASLLHSVALAAGEAVPVWVAFAPPVSLEQHDGPALTHNVLALRHADFQCTQKHSATRRTRAHIRAFDGFRGPGGNGRSVLFVSSA